LGLSRPAPSINLDIIKELENKLPGGEVGFEDLILTRIKYFAINSD